MTWNVKYIYSFSFYWVVKSSAFGHCWWFLFQKGWILWVTFLRQIAILVFQLFGIASTECKKHWNWQLWQKIEVQWVNIFDISGQKIDTFGLQSCLKFIFKITLAKSDTLWNVNVQIATVWAWALADPAACLLDLSHCCCCPLPQAPGCTCETHAVRKHAGSSLGHSGIQNLLLLCWLKELCLEYVSNHFGPCHTSLFNWIVPAAIVAAKFKTQLSEQRISTMILTLH